MAKAARTSAEFVNNAASYIGTPYVWGGASPSGFDCSGLVEYVLSSMGVKGVPRTSEEQYAWAKPVTVNNLQAGDLIFMNFPGEVSPGHVLIYAGNGRAIHAPQPGADVQTVAFQPKAKGASEWGGTIVGYGRVPGLTYTGVPNGDTSSAGKSIYQQPARPGTQQTADSGDYAGLWHYVNPLNIPGEVAHAGESALSHIPIIGGIVSGLTNLPGDISGIAQGIGEGFKFLVWLLSPKHWAMMAEVLVGVALVALGIVWLGGGEAPDIPLPFALGKLGKLGKAAGAAAAVE